MKHPCFWWLVNPDADISEMEHISCERCFLHLVKWMKDGTLRRIESHQWLAFLRSEGRYN